MNNKRGQAALEFLMTYGWAILSAIIVIGALGSYLYFQPANPKIFTVYEERILNTNETMCGETQLFYNSTSAGCVTQLIEIKSNNAEAENISQCVYHIGKPSKRELLSHLITKVLGKVITKR